MDTVAKTGSVRAFWLSANDHPMLAWYHSALGPTRNCGVVLCPPFGHEYMVSYRAHIKLAESLAAAGFPVIFFDYNDTGDSDDFGQISLATWEKNIQQASEKLREISGINQITLFGLRLGALLATSVANRQPVSALVLMAPVVSGRNYVRELQAFRNMSPIPVSSDPSRAVSEEELTGYDFSSALQQDISQLDSSKFNGRLAEHCLILSKDGTAAVEKRLFDNLRDKGVLAHLSKTDDYRSLMSDDAYNSEVPWKLWGEIVSWLSDTFPENSEVVLRQKQDLPNVTTLSTCDGELKEEIICADGLSGVLAYPVDMRSMQHRPFVILPNVGANHRVGNHRIYVSIARRIAQLGFNVLRFDRAGFGYSRATADGKEHDVYAIDGVADINTVMDYLQQNKGAESFVLAGLCSGAYFSYLAALASSRIVGLILMNQLTFQWHDGDSLEVKKAETFKSTNYYLQLLFEAKTWRRLSSGEIDFFGIAKILTKRVVHRMRNLGLGILSVFYGPEKLLGTIAQNFLSLKKRGVDLFFVFADDDSSIDLMIEHLGKDAKLLQPYNRLRAEIIPASDHTLTPKWAQAYLCQLLAHHLDERFPKSAKKVS